MGLVTSAGARHTEGLRHFLTRDLVSRQAKCLQGQKCSQPLRWPVAKLLLGDNLLCPPLPPAREPQTAVLPIPLPTTVTQAFSPP